MSDVEQPSDSDIARASTAWFAYQATEDEQYDWVIDLQNDWRENGNYEAMWRFLLKLCMDVANDDDDMIGMIGAAPLEDMIVTWPDTALRLVEAEVEKNPTMLRALAGTWTQGLPIRGRLDAILARHGQERL
ncbi:MAG TPA: hypothetical protein VNY31_04620 [Solirubrobacteraceae bacterium]|jgi:hypothetical protein|nr:hypothetical protein [Solirubrobacteraceae bacterium]